MKTEEDRQWDAYHEERRKQNQKRPRLGDMPVAVYVLRVLLVVALLAWALSRIYLAGVQTGALIAEAQHHAELEYLQQALYRCAGTVGNNGN